MINIEELKKLSGKEMIIIWSSDLKLKGGKANPMQGKVTKITAARVTLGSKGLYGQRKVTEGEYESVSEVKQPTWGERVNESCIITHKDNTYIDMIIEEKLKTTYYLNDNPIEYDDIQGAQPMENKSGVKYRRVKTNNIISVMSDDIILVQQNPIKSDLKSDISETKSD